MKRLLTGVLAVCLLCALPVSAAGDSLGLTYRASGGGVRLTLGGLTEPAYALQMELTLEGEYAGVYFDPEPADVYCPDCHVEAGAGETRVTVYLVADGDPLEGRSVLLGTLTAERSFQLPGRAELLLLDRDLKAMEGGFVSVPLSQERTSSGGGSSGGGGTVTRPAETGADSANPVRSSSSGHGSVTVRPSSAKAGETVTLTVSPDAGYELESLSVRDGGNRAVPVTREGENRYTFVMPSGTVDVTASFAAVSAPSEGSLAFRDVVPGDWCYEAVRYVFEAGLMNGTSATAFTPNSPTTRGQIVAILYRLEGSPDAGASQFADVAPGAYYASAVSWASANGIVNGYGDGTFRPGNLITREQMAAFLYRYASKKGRDVSAQAELSVFADAGQIASYAVEPLRWANAAGLINGVSADTLAPAGNATRAQVAVILSRFAQNVL